MDTSQAIIVKKIKKAEHGHHGGAWKVAFADFVTAMMAFFLLMWLMGSTTPEERAAISDYFQNPSAVQGPGGASTSMIKLGSIDQSVNEKNKGETAETKSEKSEDQTTITVEKEIEKEIEVQKDAQRLDNLKSELEKAIEASEAMKPFKDQLLLDITSEGLRIQIVDKKNRPMFDSGSSHLKDYARVILVEMSKLINKVPNKISLSGHTDATPYSSMRGYSNWELSTDRANASRRALVFGGLDKSKIAKVVGLSSTVLFDKENPRSPVNRRISIIVMNKSAEEALMRNGAAQVQSAAEIANVLEGKPQNLQTLPDKQSRPLTPNLLNPTKVPAPISPKQQLPERRKPRILGQPKVLGKTQARSLDSPASKKTTAQNSTTGSNSGSTATNKPTKKVTPKQKPKGLDERIIRPIKPITPIKLP